jgi:hypothetical protein
MRQSINLRTLLPAAVAWASLCLPPALAQGPALAKDLLMEGKVTIWGSLADAQNVHVGLYGLPFALQFANRDLAESASQFKGQNVRIVGNLKVSAEEPKLPRLDVSEIKPGQRVQEAPGEAPDSTYFKVEGEVVVRARLKKRDPNLEKDNPKLEYDAVLSTAIPRIGTIPVYFKGEADALDGFVGRHQAALGKAPKELAKKVAALQDREVLVRALLQGHNFLTRSEYISYLILDVQAAD